MQEGGAAAGVRSSGCPSVRGCEESGEDCVVRSGANGGQFQPMASEL